MKKHKIVFWITTLIIFLFESVMTFFTYNSEMAKEGISHLGYPPYFGPMLMVFKVIGGLFLVLPFIPKRLKEWAYVGFGIDFIAAFVSILAVDGWTPMAFFPLVFLVILILSYRAHTKLQTK